MRDSVKSEEKLVASILVTVMGTSTPLTSSIWYRSSSAAYFSISLASEGTMMWALATPFSTSASASAALTLTAPIVSSMANVSSSEIAFVSLFFDIGYAPLIYL